MGLGSYGVTTDAESGSDFFVDSVIECIDWSLDVRGQADVGRLMHVVFVPSERASASLLSEACVTFAQAGDVTYAHGRGMCRCSDWQLRAGMLRRFSKGVRARGEGDVCGFATLSLGGRSRGRRGVEALVRCGDELRRAWGTDDVSFCYAVHPAEMSGGRICDMHMHVAWFAEGAQRLDALREVVSSLDAA